MEMVERPFNDVKASIQKGASADDGPQSFVVASLLASADDDDHIQVS